MSPYKESSDERIENSVFFPYRMSARIPGLFITGTDTGVGKTYVGR